MLRIVVSFGAVVFALWFAFTIVTGIDRGDVVAYENIQKHVKSQKIEAGDVVRLSPVGMMPSLVCSMDVAEGVLEEVPIARTYVNELSESLPGFTKLADWIAGFFGRESMAPAPSVNGSKLRFVGWVSTFPVEGVMAPMSPECACAIAQSMIDGYRLCTVERSLIEKTLVPAVDGQPSKIEAVTVGLTVREAAFFFSDPSKLDCPRLQGVAPVPLTREQGLCVTGLERSFDVALRQNLSLIRGDALED
jgi:hypothetical protein